MPEPEQRLEGGNTAESVVRLGSTVRKPVTVATAAVHALLRHLRAKGFDGCPEAIGVDEQHRQVLEYVPGMAWYDGPERTPAELHRVGRLIRQLHDAAATFDSPAGAVWDCPAEPNGRDLLCHNDLAPWNLVCGPDRWAFIDWDNAGPGTRLWDLAWASISFPPLMPGDDVLAPTARWHAMLAGYGLERASYRELIRLMVVRARGEGERIVAEAKEGRQPWARLYDEKHHEYWGPVADSIERHASALHASLVALDRGAA